MKIHSDGVVTALILEKGEHVHECIKKVARDMDIEGAFITGIGGVRDVTVAYPQLEQKRLLETRLEGFFEMLTLNGNIAWEDGNPVAHLHAILGKEDMSVAGGHLIQATIGTTGEIFIHKIGKRLERKKVEGGGPAQII